MVCAHQESLSRTGRLRMMMDSSEMTQRILNVTLEIIYLLTGEDYGPVKTSVRYAGLRKTQSPTAALPAHSEKPHKKKIVDLANTIIELLTGEVAVRCQDVAVYLSVEEWEYLEGHKDLYNEVTIETQQRLPSPDKSSKRNTSERRPRSESPQETTEEGDSILQDDQDGSLKVIKVEVEETEMWGDEPYEEEEEEETNTCIYTGKSSKKNTSERHPRPESPQETTEEDCSVPQDDQDETLTVIKVEVEETEMWGDEPYEEEEETTTYIEKPIKRSRAGRRPRSDSPEETTEEGYSVPQEYQDGSLRIIKVEAEDVDRWEAEQRKRKKSSSPEGLTREKRRIHVPTAENTLSIRLR
ncbi:oocyte zinc finger protein XlCOF7.1-like isoform X2 [Eleutherodactylus coqui]|uniref:oocyte zinc finger protein XlCOF7.1-like isoform X2 n=1 Tax=Eleutherodactylus coqui TaxID=57060 RepID=UPI003461E9F2